MIVSMSGYSAQDLGEVILLIVLILACELRKSVSKPICQYTKIGLDLRASSPVCRLFLGSVRLLKIHDVETKVLPYLFLTTNFYPVFVLKSACRALSPPFCSPI